LVNRITEDIITTISSSKGYHVESCTGKPIFWLQIISLVTRDGLSNAVIFVTIELITEERRTSNENHNESGRPVRCRMVSLNIVLRAFVAVVRSAAGLTSPTPHPHFKTRHHVCLLTIGGYYLLFLLPGLWARAFPLHSWSTSSLSKTTPGRPSAKTQYFIFQIRYQNA
jgi:hypothetical protein